MVLAAEPELLGIAITAVSVAYLARSSMTVAPAKLLRDMFASVV